MCQKTCVFFPKLGKKRAYVGQGAQRTQKANHDQAEDKELAPVGEMIGVLVQHRGDDGLQAAELKTKDRQSSNPGGKTSPEAEEAWSRTVLSSPSIIIITKKMMAKNVEPIMFAMASG